MPRTARCLQGRAFYLIKARGLETSVLFRDEEDFSCYMRLLKRFKRKGPVCLYGFCLLPDSIQMVIQSPSGKLISHFIQRTHQTYTTYYNNRYERQGKLWHDRFKSYLIRSFEDVVETIKILELQPVIHRLSSSPVRYPWSSCIHRVIGARNSIIDRLLNPDSKSCEPIIPPDIHTICMGNL
ncbi:MAG: hypothetical protein K8S27_00640 [Candidatus Omnitrophica bacterium]|nr:hypothetical protein [Candidatus Omnitrophota bacterium]